jgi:gluconolactonase
LPPTARSSRAKGKVIEITHDIAKPNGIAITPDGKTLIAADHDNGTDKIDPTKPTPKIGNQQIVAWDLDKDGLVSGKKRVLIDYKDAAGCDGMTVDAAGRIYLTIRDVKRPGIQVIDVKGKELAFIPTGPANQSPTPEKPALGLPSNVEFGLGDELSTLYVTIDLSLYRITLGAKGYHVQFAK